MRKIHIIMFGGQFVLSLVFSLLLFCGILGEYALFAFVYPVLVCIALPKILKIVIFDIINQQRYLHNYIKV